MACHIISTKPLPELENHVLWVPVCTSADLLPSGTYSVKFELKHCQTFNIWRTLTGNVIVDHSEAVGALPVGAAPTTSSFST